MPPLQMRALVFEGAGRALRLAKLPVPKPEEDQVLLKVRACGVCRTDLHVVDGDLTDPQLPVIPGHQIVGEVVACGAMVVRFKNGERVGVPWLGGSCGDCFYCQSGNENLCDSARYTGYQIQGGFAEYCVARADFCFPISQGYPDHQAAPLLCAGLIGYRALAMAGEGRNLGFYGFGAAAHILAQVAKYQQRHVFAFVRPGDEAAKQFAETMGAVWSGDSTQLPPEPLDAALIFAPAGALVPAALKAVRKGGVVVCAGIHMSDIPSFPYADLWGERVVRSVANLTRKDGQEFMALAPRIPIETTVHVYGLEDAPKALDDLRAGRFTGAAVIDPRQ